MAEVLDQQSQQQGLFNNAYINKIVHDLYLLCQLFKYYVSHTEDHLSVEKFGSRLHASVKSIAEAAKNTYHDYQSKSKHYQMKNKMEPEFYSDFGMTLLLLLSACIPF